MAHPLFTPEVRLMLEENNEAALAELCDALHPATIGETLDEGFTVEEVWRILGHTSIQNQAAIFEYFPLERQVELVEGTGRQHMARLIEEMSPDDRADLLRRLPQPVADSLLRLVDEADRRNIATLVQYPEGTAGALMTTDYAWLPDNITAGEALERLRLQAPDAETVYYVYVLNDQRKLLGVVSLRDLILKPRQATIRDIMSEEVVTVKATDDRETVAQEMARYDLLAIPVVDAEGRLVGIVTHDDVIDVVVSEATEDLQRQAGVGPLSENYLEASFVKVWWHRAVWLAALFIAEMFTFNAMAYFDDAMKAVTVLALFVPLCISTGGNSGSQAATLITRALALGQATTSAWFRVLRHEIAMGLALGLTLGTIAVARTYFLTPGHVLETPDSRVVALSKLTLVIGLAVMGICLWGTLVGSMLPLVFKRIGVDPAVASSPFVATFVDVTGIVIYFNIARIVLSEFLT
ncbi:MAG TPA: magnesium transporter [Gemmataceae bacterium]|nr:magnesium transporter [Gemmataceae bacterium]